MAEGTRGEILRERQAEQRRIHWQIPGAVWSMDPTELTLPCDDQCRKLRLLPVMDLASRYKFAPWAGEHLTGEQVAAHLDELFRRHGPPLVLKRDNGSNLNDEAVNELLSRWLVIPLNSPPHYPPYNGGMERAQRELKTALRPQLLANPSHHPAGLARLTVLNSITGPAAVGGATPLANNSQVPNTTSAAILTAAERSSLNRLANWP
ncbi:MAG TPA: transposase family protein [Verrucomicrobiae bacterium]|nr:transposase family protein [Verrucomicrobiae bacterium]